MIAFRMLRMEDDQIKSEIEMVAFQDENLRMLRMEDDQIKSEIEMVAFQDENLKYTDSNRYKFW
jgi:hypothetical protein